MTKVIHIEIKLANNSKDKYCYRIGDFGDCMRFHNMTKKEMLRDIVDELKELSMETLGKRK